MYGVNMKVIYTSVVLLAMVFLCGVYCDVISRKTVGPKNKDLALPFWLNKSLRDGHFFANVDGEDVFDNVAYVADETIDNVGQKDSRVGSAAQSSGNNSSTEPPSEDILFNVVFGEVEEDDVPVLQTLLIKPRIRGYESAEFVRAYPSNGEKNTRPIKGLGLRCGLRTCDLKNDEFSIEDGGIGQQNIKLRIKTKNERLYGYRLHIFTE